MAAQIIAGIGATNEEKFQQILDWDKSTYQSIVKIRAFQQSIWAALASYDKGNRKVITSQSQYNAIKAKLNASYPVWYDLQTKYNNRQTDIQTNTLYRLSNSLKEWSDGAASWFKKAWNSVSGVGLAPLAVPLIIAAGSVLAITAVAYFVSKYYTDSGTQYNTALQAVNNLASVNPTLAAEMNKQISAFYTKKQDDQGGGFFNELGKGLGAGLKYGLIGLTLVGGSFGVYKLGEIQGWWKPKKRRK